MADPVKPIPDGYPSLTPYLTVRGAAQAIDFYQRAFGAQERMRMASPDGSSIGHAELLIGDALIMLADEVPGMGNPAPQALNGSPVGFALYVDDVDAAFARAVSAGATVVRPVADQFYGDRTGMITDPFGHQWSLMTHIEDVSPDEMQRRAAAVFSAVETATA